MKNKFYNNQKGLTLVELLAALTILAIIIIPTFQLIGNTYSVYIDDQRKLQALTIAQGNIEEAKYNDVWLNNFGNGSYPAQTGYYRVSRVTKDDYVTEILMKDSTVNGAQTVKILVNTYWREIKSDALLTFLVVEVRKLK